MKTISTHSYDPNTGMVNMTQTYNYDSKNDINNLGGTNYTITRYKYFWEQYDTFKSLNILSPVIQTKQEYVNSASNKVLSASATTWKTWGANNTWAPHKSYIWKRTGTSTDFDFTNWSRIGEPPADWIKTSEINTIDAKGNVIQVTSK